MARKSAAEEARRLAESGLELAQRRAELERLLGGRASVQAAKWGLQVGSYWSVSRPQGGGPFVLAWAALPGKPAGKSEHASLEEVAAAILEQDRPAGGGK